MRLIAWLIVLPALTVWCDETSAQPVPKQTVLDISFETTRIVEPLDGHGFVDYLAASNRAHSKGVTAENNFEVVVQQVAAPAKDANVDGYFERLGMEEPKPPFFTGFVDWIVHEKHLRDEKNELDIDKLFSVADFVENHPWSPEQYPDVTKWLSGQNEFLDRLVLGGKLARNFAPFLVAQDKEEKGIAYPHIVMSVSPSAHAQQKIASAFEIRANLRLAEHDLETAWNDTITVLRIARLTSQGASIIHPMVGVVVDQKGFDSAVRILQSPGISDQLVDRMVVDLNQLPRFAATSEKIDQGERYCALSTLQWCASSTDINVVFERLEDFALFPPNEQMVATTLVKCQVGDANQDRMQRQELRATDINWNRSAKIANHWYDRLSLVCAEYDFVKRTELLRRFKDDLAALEERAEKLVDAFSDGMPGQSRDERGDAFGEILVSLFLPPLPFLSTVELEVRQRRDVLQLSLAAESFKRKSFEYPRDLDELVGDQVASIPHDYFSPNPVEYRRTRNGFVLYSLGRNLKNDLGRNYNDRGTRKEVPWDDIVVRVKR